MAENSIITAKKAVVIGGSTGSIDVLLQVLPVLSVPLTYICIIVLHRRNTADSTLAHLLSLKTTIPVREVEDKEPVRPGIIYLAPADYHVLIERDRTFALDDSEKVNYSRPSIDVTFESAAEVFGPSLIGVLLSGANADGTAGLKAIKKKGGLLVTQLPATAQAAMMPQQAILNTQVDYILDIQGISSLLNNLNL
ncbi:chemotaxis protein CheB [Spirosoma sp. 48-14]|uniref:chemotaxis protein CheB n=1 Tax=Spirosoma sp. 48-14 TaxID=1895854 RepID=UPI00095BBF91|nr:chemotaxis protein CheB [Spirosoma sp. 48-14]OJW71243.1 MAG: chemotaxis protein CheB [Spirosoma sp. 48-14]